MASRGAWPFAYRLGLDFRNDPQGRNAHGMAAFKRELIFVGCDAGIIMDSHVWEPGTDESLRVFQQEQGLTADGQLGPETASLLLRRRASDVEYRNGIQPGLLCRLKTHLSQDDPVAEGCHDLDCEGLVQINLRFYPAISTERAWDPLFALEHAAQRLRAAHTFVGEDWDGAVASYAIGRLESNTWVSSGKPPTGGLMLGGRDTFERASEFVAAVKEAAC